MHDVTAVWHAIVTPHQTLRGELAAWPHGMSPLRMIQFMGGSADPNLHHKSPPDALSDAPAAYAPIRRPHMQAQFLTRCSQVPLTEH